MILPQQRTLVFSSTSRDLQGYQMEKWQQIGMWHVMQVLLNLHVRIPDQNGLESFCK